MNKQEVTNTTKLHDVAPAAEQQHVQDSTQTLNNPPEPSKPKLWKKAGKKVKSCITNNKATRKLKGLARRFKRFFFKNSHKPIKMPETLIQEFIDRAAENTANKIETVALLGAVEEDGVWIIRKMVFPDQKGSRDWCHPTDQGELDQATHLIEEGLIVIGWIHSHPSQDCFLSSVDLHTQLNYQLQNRDVIAVVVSFQKEEPEAKIYRITDAPGMNILRTCQGGGTQHHEHTQPREVLFEDAKHVRMSTRSLTVVDTRKKQ